MATLLLPKAPRNNLDVILGAIGHREEDPALPGRKGFSR